MWERGDGILLNEVAGARQQSLDRFQEMLQYAPQSVRESVQQRLETQLPEKEQKLDRISRGPTRRTMERASRN